MAMRTLKVSLFANYFLFAILLNSVGTVIFQVQNVYDVSESAASVLEAYKDISIVLASFLVGSYIARLGYKRAMLLALALVACACLAMPQLPAFWMTKLLFAVTGVSFAIVKVCVYASISLLARDPPEHASTMNFLEAFFMVGVLAGYFLFGAFVNDLDPTDPSWLRVYYLLAIVAMLALALLSSVPAPASASGASEPVGEVTGYRAMLRLFALPLVYLFLLCAFLYVLIEQSIMTWLPTFNSRVLNLSPSLAIQMTSILAFATALGRFAAGFLLRYLHWYALLTICLIAAAVLVLLVLPLAESSSAARVTQWMDAPAAAWLLPLLGALLAPVYPAINSVILSSLQPGQYAPMAGLIVLFSALGGTTGSLITGTLFELMDGRSAFYFTLVPLGGLMVMLTLFRRSCDA